MLGLGTGDDVSEGDTEEVLPMLAISLPNFLKNSVTPSPEDAILRLREEAIDEALSVLRSSAPNWTDDGVLGVVVLVRGVEMASFKAVGLGRAAGGNSIRRGQRNHCE